MSTSKFTEESHYVSKKDSQTESTDSAAKAAKREQPPQKKKRATPRKRKKENAFPDLSGMSMEDSALDEYERLANEEAANDFGEDGENTRKRRSGGFQICDRGHICVRELRGGNAQEMMETIFKDIPDVSYDPVEGEWRFPIEMQDKVVQNYKKARISCNPVPKEPIKALVIQSLLFKEHI